MRDAALEPFFVLAFRRVSAMSPLISSSVILSAPDVFASARRPARAARASSPQGFVVVFFEVATRFLLKVHPTHHSTLTRSDALQGSAR